MTVSRTLILVRIPLVIHVVQEPDGFPEIGIRAAVFGEVLEGIGYGVAMTPQTFRLDPFVQNPERLFGQHLSLLDTPS
jgi:hypothetical protein